MAAVLGMVVMLAPALQAQDQTATFSPVVVNGSLPFDLGLSMHDMGSASVPTLQSYAFGQVGNNYVFVSGRTNGLHDFSNNGTLNFPPAFQNADIWVINPVTQQTWSRSLSDATSGLTTAQQDSLSATSTVFYQGNATTLYVAGGYMSSTVDGNTTFSTSSNLTALNLPGVINWVQTGTGSLASNIRQTSDPALQITGGGMTQVGGKTQITFGQNFDGAYGFATPPTFTQTYSEQIRSFNIIDNGATLSIANVSNSSIPSDPSEPYHRRDLNIVPTLTPDGHGNLTPGQAALAGVFTLTNGVWTVPVEISANGTPSMKDPSDPSAFKQAMNQYQSAVVSLYDTSSNISHNVLFGGISVNTYNATTGNLDYDGGAPWTGQTTDVARDASGNYVQYLMGNATFPMVTFSGNIMSDLLGGGAQFLPADGLPLMSNGMIDMANLTGNTLLGYIYGGIISELPETNSSTQTHASGYLFDVYYTPSAVPEPATVAMIMGLVCGGLALARRRPAKKS